jgi:hypothetical protein
MPEPRPTNGIVIAMTVIVATLASSDSPAMLLVSFAGEISK